MKGAQVLAAVSNLLILIIVLNIWCWTTETGTLSFSDSQPPRYYRENAQQIKMKPFRCYGRMSHDGASDCLSGDEAPSVPRGLR